MRTAPAREASPGGLTGTVTVLQRAGSGLNANPHVHTLALDGVFRPSDSGALEFSPAPAASDDDVAEVLAVVRDRVRRLLQRRGLDLEGDATGPVDRLPEDAPLLAGIVSASVQGRVALGARAGRRGRRLGQEPDAEGVTSRGPRQTHVDGFDLHANVWVAANDRAGLERLCRYVLRPPFAQARRRLRADGRVALERKRAWHDGTRELVFEPLEFLERLAAMTPRPETNLLICHGLLAPRARWRRLGVAYGRVPTDPPSASAAVDAPAPAPHRAREQGTSRSWSWAALMHRAFAIDVLACPPCGGRLQLIATIPDPAVIRKILAHLGRSQSGQSPGPAPPEPTAAAL